MLEHNDNSQWLRGGSLILLAALLLTIKGPVLQILLENHEFCKYAKLLLHIHIIVDLNQNIA